MGTKIIETGSTAGGVAKVEYKDEAGNVLYEVNDSDKIFKMVNGKISGLAGTGNRMVVADSSGNLSAPLNNFVTTYNEGTLDNVPNAVWTVLMECPTGKTTLAITIIYESFSGAVFYYSQAEFARALTGTPVTIYAVDGGTAFATKARINGNNIEVMQTSGGASPVMYRYTVTNSLV